MAALMVLSVLGAMPAGANSSSDNGAVNDWCNATFDATTGYQGEKTSCDADSEDMVETVVGGYQGVLSSFAGCNDGDAQGGTVCAFGFDFTNDGVANADPAGTGRYTFGSDAPIATSNTITVTPVTGAMAPAVFRVWLTTVDLATGIETTAIVSTGASLAWTQVDCFSTATYTAPAGSAIVNVIGVRILGDSMVGGCLSTDTRPRTVTNDVTYSTMTSLATVGGSSSLMMVPNAAGFCDVTFTITADRPLTNAGKLVVYVGWNGLILDEIQSTTLGSVSLSEDPLTLTDFANTGDTMTIWASAFEYGDDGDEFAAPVSATCSATPTPPPTPCIPGMGTPCPCPAPFGGDFLPEGNGCTPPAVPLGWIPPQCLDGIDNDGDGQSDLADAACDLLSGGNPLLNEDGTLPVGQCFDGIDNDGDTFSDGEDPECFLGLVFNEDGSA